MNKVQVAPIPLALEALSPNKVDLMHSNFLIKEVPKNPAKATNPHLFSNPLMNKDRPLCYIYLKNRSAMH